MPTLKSRVGHYVIPLLPFNRRTFDICRHELRAWCTRALNTVSPKYHSRVAALRKQTELSANIGSGGKGLPGWVNIELLPAIDTTLCLDIRRPLPFADGSVARIFAEHVVEHVDFRHDLPNMLADWLRVLRPGGTVRIIVPDLEKYIQAYVARDLEMWKTLGWDVDNLPTDMHTPMHILNHVFHQEGEHLFGYDFETMGWALRHAGFSIVQKSAYQVCLDPDLCIDQENHAIYSLYVDAVK